jgi:hypothetical protein
MHETLMDFDYNSGSIDSPRFWTFFLGCSRWCDLAWSLLHPIISYMFITKFAKEIPFGKKFLYILNVLMRYSASVFGGTLYP